MNILEELTLLGGTRLASFSQGDYRGDHTVVEGADISDGYCAGVSLDWMRRVLLSRVDRDQKFLGFSSDHAADETTLQRMAVAYANQASSYVAETKKTQLVRELEKLTLQPEKSLSFDGAVKTGVPIPANVGQLLLDNGYSKMEAEFAKGYAVVAMFTPARIKSLLAAVRAAPDSQHRARTREGREWDQFAGELDASSSEIRVAKSRKVSAKPFSQVKVVRTSQAKAYASGGAWLGEVMAHAFQTGCCTILDFGYVGGGGGHVVAVHRTTATDFILFDPNFGAFKYTEANLKKALQHLFWSPAVTADAGILDGEKGYYLRRNEASNPVRTRMDDVGYTVFGRA